MGATYNPTEFGELKKAVTRRVAWALHSGVEIPIPVKF